MRILTFGAKVLLFTAIATAICIADCQPREFSPTVPADAPVRGDSLSVWSDAHGSLATLKLTNIGTQGVTGALALVSTFGQAGEYQATLVFYAKEKGTPSIEFATQGGGAPLWSTALAKGNSVDLGGYSPVLHNECTSRAEITGLFLRLSDGRQYRYAAKDWRLDPDLASARPIDVSAESLPLDLLAGVRINADGTAAVTQIFQGGDQMQWLNEQLRKWKFDPAYRDGSPVSLDMTIRFIFCACPPKHDFLGFGPPGPEMTEPSTGSLIVIRVFFADNKDKQLVFSGVAPISY